MSSDQSIDSITESCDTVISIDEYQQELSSTNDTDDNSEEERIECLLSSIRHRIILRSFMRNWLQIYRNASQNDSVSQ